MKKAPIKAKINKVGFTDSGLPTSDKISETVEQVTPDRVPGEKKNTNTLRTTKITKDGRARLNTTIKPDLKTKLVLDALKRRATLADVLEDILLEWYSTR